MSLDCGLESSGLLLQDSEVLLFLGDEDLEVHGLGETWSSNWSDDLWLLPDGTSEHLVSPVVFLDGWDDWLAVVGGADDSLGNDQLLVDLLDGNSSLVDLSNQLLDLLVDVNFSLSKVDGLSGQLSDDSLDDSNLLSLSLDDRDGSWLSDEWSDLGDVDLDDLSDDLDFLLDVDDLDSEFSDLLGEFNGLGDVLLDDVGVLLDLDVDLGDSLDEFDDLGNVLDDSDSGGLIFLSDWLWLDANHIWSLVRVQLGSDQTESLVAFSGDGELSDLLALLVEDLEGFNEGLDGLLVGFGVLTAEDWGDEQLSAVGDLSDDLSLFSDKDSGGLDLLNDDGDLLLQLGDLLDEFGLLGNFGGLVDDDGDLLDLSLDDSDALDVLLDDNEFLPDDLVDLLDLDLLFLSEDADLLLLDDGDLLSDLLDGDSDLVDLDGQGLQDRSVLLNLLDEFDLLFWDSDDLSVDSSDSSLDDNSLGDELVNGDGELVDHGSELDELFLDWLWSQAVSVWNFEFSALLGDGVALGGAFASLGEEEVALSLDGSELVSGVGIGWGLVAGSFEFGRLLLEVLELVVDALALGFTGFDLDGALLGGGDFFWGLDASIDWSNVVGNLLVNLGDLGDVNLNDLSVLSDDANQFLDFDLSDVDLFDDNLLLFDVGHLLDVNDEFLQGFSVDGQFLDDNNDLLESFSDDLLVFDDLVLDWLWMET